jgi:toxin ParE1/3/4
MFKNPRVEISQAAEHDLDEIGYYIASESDIDRGKAVVDTIIDKIELRATMPNGGRMRGELRPGMRSFVVYSYVVFYRPLDDGIRVIRVLQGSRDFEAEEFSDEDDV